jgi:DNA (cytosine-5)-methyltransferase 1
VSRVACRKSLAAKIADSPVSAVDLFCGAGGLTHGLLQAGIKVEAGIDIDKQAEYAFVTNNPETKYLAWDVGRKKYPSIEKLFAKGKYRLLAGCAPCQPFSKLTQAISNHQCWDLLKNFARFIDRIQPELITMENVPELAERGQEVFDHFVDTLERLDYYVDWKIVKCEEYGVPQFRRRLVLLASKLSELKVPDGRYRSEKKWKTVRTTIGDLPPLESGEEHPRDRLHVASRLSEINLRRIRATRPDGGNRREWPEDLVLECHKRETGDRYHSIYGRMWWDKPSPTMTTLCTGIGNGRFGHPEQHRSITLREAALLQSFPRSYQFWPRGTKLNRGAVSRMIGNAVPPRLAKALGRAIMEHVSAHDSTG